MSLVLVQGMLQETGHNELSDVDEFHIRARNESSFGTCIPFPLCDTNSIPKGWRKVLVTTLKASCKNRLTAAKGTD